jgi:hypothetical protein
LRVEPPARMTVEEFEKRLRKGLARASNRNAEPDDTETAEFLTYDYETFEWQFKVTHFIKWATY